VFTYRAYFSYDNFIIEQMLSEVGEFWMKFDSQNRRFYGTPLLSNISNNNLGKY
jgi:hypothetical protein